MANNVVKYSVTSQTEALKIGNWWIGTGDVGKGPTDTTDYWNGISPPALGYAVYGKKASDGPSIYLCSDDLGLIDITNKNGSQNFTQAFECLQWYTTQTDQMAFNRDYESVITNGLLINLDAGFVASYPLSGPTWSNIGITNNADGLFKSNGTTALPSFSESGLSITFTDTNYNWISINNIGDLSQFTVEVWVYLTKSLSGKVTSIITNEYDGANLNFSIGTNNAPDSYNLCVGFSNGDWRNTVGFTPSLNTWYQVVGTYDGVTLVQYVNGVANGGTLSYSGTAASGGNIRLMRRWDSNFDSGNFVDGELAITRVYDRALSSEEVLKNYQAQSPRFA